MKKQNEILKIIYDTQESERTRIAQDLHDDIGAKLSTLKLQNEMLLNEKDIDLTTKYAEKNASSINQIVKGIRVIARNQASYYIRNNGIERELEQLRLQFITASKIDIHLDMDIKKINLDKDFEVNLFRILQELLHNSIKHSNCNEINLKIISVNNGLSIFYSDNGKGIEPGKSNQTGMGLQNIQTRISLFKGVSNMLPAAQGVSYHFFFDAKHALEKKLDMT